MQIKAYVQQGDSALSFHISFLPHNHTHFKQENETVISEKCQLINLNQLHKFIYKDTQYWRVFNGWQDFFFLILDKYISFVYYFLVIFNSLHNLINHLLDIKVDIVGKYDRLIIKVSISQQIHFLLYTCCSEQLSYLTGKMIPEIINNAKVNMGEYFLLGFHTKM